MIKKLLHYAMHCLCAAFILTAQLRVKSKVTFNVSFVKIYVCPSGVSTCMLRVEPCYAITGWSSDIWFD